jgi:hypothetical protein
MTEAIKPSLGKASEDAEQEPDRGGFKTWRGVRTPSLPGTPRGIQWPDHAGTVHLPRHAGIRPGPWCSGPQPLSLATRMRSSLSQSALSSAGRAANGLILQGDLEVKRGAGDRRALHGTGSCC